MKLGGRAHRGTEGSAKAQGGTHQATSWPETVVFCSGMPNEIAALLRCEVQKSLETEFHLY